MRLYWKESQSIRDRETAPQDAVLPEKHIFLIWRAVAVLAGALLMTWPAILNRYPLLYPDSMTYLESGRLVGRALFLHKLSDYYGMRSFIYSLGIFPFHWNVTLWPIVALNALLTAYMIWLAVRPILPRKTVFYFLILCAALSLLTSLSWFVSLIMPDLLASLLFLCIYLLVFARETLSYRERLAVILIAWWAVASHGSHLIIASADCVFLALLLLPRWRAMHGRARAVAELALVILLAAAAQVALNTYLDGTPSLNSNRPPFLMARVIADGPGRLYLQQHCKEARFAVCENVDHLPVSTDEFLWGTDGIWESASDEKKSRLIQEEIPFVLSTLRTYPREQITRSAANFWQQLTTFSLDDLGKDDWLLEEFDHALPGKKLQSRQAQDALPLDMFDSVQNWTVIASLGIIGAFIPYLRRRRPERIMGFGLIVASSVIFNACVTGVLSGVEPRYQSRVIWLLPLLAGVLVLNWRDHRRLGQRANAE